MADRSSSAIEHALIVSSDGHATAQMRDYRPYLDPGFRDEFDAFCDRFDQEGMTTVNPKSLANRIDAELVQQWVETVLAENRVAGQWDPALRLRELDREGISAEVIFPDFGLPFELHPPLVAAILGHARPPEHVEAANKAYNRWLVDFCHHAPDRLNGVAVLSFADIDATVAEIEWAKDHGLVGLVLPAMDENTPVYHPRFEPVWDAVEATGLVVCTHTAISSITNHLTPGALQVVPHPACATPIMTAQAYFFTQQLLTHMVWGGVLERHPDLHLGLTEQGTGWVVSAVQGMDYSWNQSYLRRDVRQVVKHPPSFYFERQVHMGSSLFSRAEAEMRLEIGVDKIMIGADYPHHEGTWGAGPGTTKYLQATLGAAGVPIDDARLMVGQNAIGWYGLDRTALRNVADKVGIELGILVQPPTADYFPRGDVHKPLATAF